MSRGHGAIQGYLMDLIVHSPDPMTFAQIMAVTFPAGSYEFDIAKICGGSNVGRVRSLRRALRRLCDDECIMRIGEGGRGDPHRYWLNPIMVAMVCDKDRYDEVNKRIEADPAMVKAANAAAKRFMGARAKHKLP